MRQLFPDPAPDFSDPLGLLRACHERILRHCTTLERLPGHLEQHGADSDFESAITAIQRYFNTAGRHHHADESIDLFPLLHGLDPALDRLISELDAQHGELESHWSRLNQALTPPIDPSGRELRNFIIPFTTLQREHVARENRELLPMAAVRLNAEQQQRLARAMAGRRGVSPGKEF